jgi:hypothetical protein
MCPSPMNPTFMTAPSFDPLASLHAPRTPRGTVGLELTVRAGLFGRYVKCYGMVNS